MQPVRQDSLEAWKVAVNRNWESVQRIQRGECRADCFMEFCIAISDATFANLIKTGELRWIAAGHLRLYADIDTKLGDTRGELVYSVCGQRRRLPDWLASCPPPRQNATAEKVLALAQELRSFSSEMLEQAMDLAAHKGLLPDNEVALYDVLGSAERHSRY